MTRDDQLLAEGFPEAPDPCPPVPSWHPGILESLLWEWAVLGLGEKLAAGNARPGSLQTDCVQSNLTLQWESRHLNPSPASPHPQIWLNPSGARDQTMDWYDVVFLAF